MPVNESSPKFAQVEQRTPNWTLFLVQFFPLTPLAVGAVWLVIGFLVQASGLLDALNVPRRLADVEADVNGAITLLLSSFVAGLILGRFWPVLRASGRFVFLPSLLMAISFVFKWQQYAQYASRTSLLLTVLDWACDPSMYIPYGYAGYSIAMAILSQRR